MLDPVAAAGAGPILGVWHAISRAEMHAVCSQERTETWGGLTEMDPTAERRLFWAQIRTGDALETQEWSTK